MRCKLREKLQEIIVYSNPTLRTKQLYTTNESFQTRIFRTKQDWVKVT